MHPHRKTSTASRTNSHPQIDGGTQQPHHANHRSPKPCLALPHPQRGLRAFQLPEGRGTNLCHWRLPTAHARSSWHRLRPSLRGHRLAAWSVAYRGAVRGHCGSWPLHTGAWHTGAYCGSSSRWARQRTADHFRDRRSRAHQRSVGPLPRGPPGGALVSTCVRVCHCHRRPPLLAVLCQRRKYHTMCSFYVTVCITRCLHNV